LLHEKDRANLPLVEALIRQRFTGLVFFVTALVPMIAIWLFSVRQKNWSLLFAALVAFVASGEAAIDVVFEPALAEQRSFKPFMERCASSSSRRFAFVYQPSTMAPCSTRSDWSAARSRLR
jgi:hypothetical protein